MIFADIVDIDEPGCYLASGAPAPGPGVSFKTIRLVLSERLGQAAQFPGGDQHGFCGGRIEELLYKCLVNIFQLVSIQSGSKIIKLN